MSDEMMTRMWMAVGTLNGAAGMLIRMRMVFGSDADAVDSEAGVVDSEAGAVDSDAEANDSDA